MRKLIVPLIFGLAVGIHAQDSVEKTPNPGLEHLLASSLSLAAEGKWEAALILLEDAQFIDSEDSRIDSYRSSIVELMAIDRAQSAWNEGQSSRVENEAPKSPEEEVGTETPKFVIERDEYIIQGDISRYRDQFRGEVSFGVITHDEVNARLINTWSSLESFFYSSFGADIRYWFPFLGRSLGINFRNSGYAWIPSDPEILLNSLDLGINLRGFLIEDQQSRLELGLDFGGSLHTMKTIRSQQVDHSGVLYLGLWVSDPIFFHLFKAENLKNLVFGGGIRVYSSIGAELLENVYYRVDASWKFKNFNLGARLEWWGILESGQQHNPLSISMYGGIHF